MIKQLTIPFFLTLIFLTFFSGVNAQFSESSPSPSLTSVPILKVNDESVNPPDGLSYLFKRISEKVSIFFAFSNKNKVEIYKRLLRIRLSELKYVIEKKEMGYFETATKRYFTTAGQLTEFVTASKLKDEFMSVKDELSLHIPVLIKLRDSYDSGTAEWRFVEDDINYIKGYIINLSK